jgi:hypothetical protein
MGMSFGYGAPGDKQEMISLISVGVWSGGRLRPRMGEMESVFVTKPAGKTLDYSALCKSFACAMKSAGI